MTFRNCLEPVERVFDTLVQFYNKIIEIDPKFGGQHSCDEFLHTYFVLSSRFMGICDIDPMGYFIVPYADMVNCRGSINKTAYWKYDNISNSVVVIADGNLSKGDTVIFLLIFHVGPF